jgi:hypothetical protein
MPSTNGVRFKGMFYSLVLTALAYDITPRIAGRGRMKFVDPELHRTTITIQFVLWSLFHIYLASVTVLHVYNKQRNIKLLS